MRAMLALKIHPAELKIFSMFSLLRNSGFWITRYLSGSYSCCTSGQQHSRMRGLAWRCLISRHRQHPMRVLLQNLSATRGPPGNGSGYPPACTLLIKKPARPGQCRNCWHTDMVTQRFRRGASTTTTAIKDDVICRCIQCKLHLPDSQSGWR